MIWRRVVLGLLALTALFSGSIVVSAAPAGSRAISMGGAYVAVSNDAEAVFYNPAGLWQLDERSLELGQWFGDDLEFLESRNTGLLKGYAVYAEPDTGMGAGGLGWTYSKKLDGLDPVSGEPVVRSTHTIIYSYANELGRNASWGASLKYEFAGLGATQTIPSNSGKRLDFDLGILFSPSRKVKLGLVAYDILSAPLKWSDGSSESESKFSLTPGAALEVTKDTLLSIDLKNILGADDERSVAVGIENRFGPELVFRTGLQLPLGEERSNVQEWNVGFGYQIDSWALGLAVNGDTDGSHTYALGTFSYSF